MKTGTHNELLHVLRPYGDFLLTARGTLVGAVEFEGIDPDAMNPDALDEMAVIGAVISRPIQRMVDQMQTYLHFEGGGLDFKERDHEISDMLNEERRKALLSRGLAESRIVHYFEVRPTRGAQHNWIDLVVALVQAPFDGNARKQLQAKLNAGRCLTVSRSELGRQHEVLRETIESYCAKWGAYTRVKPLSIRRTVSHMRFLATLDPRYLKLPGTTEDHINARLTAGTGYPGMLENMAVWVTGGPEERYVRIGALGAPQAQPKAGLFAKPPRGNYLLVSRFMPKTEIEREHEFRAREISVHQRATLSEPMAIINNESIPKDKMRAALRDELLNLEAAEALNTVWGSYHCYLAIFGTEAKTIRETAIALDTMVASRTGQSVVWENVRRDKAYAAFQPDGASHSVRNQLVTLDKAQDYALIFRSHPGQVRTDYYNEESVYVFETATGEPFHWSPWIYDRAFILGVGPTGSGKSFTKNTLCSHMLKLGGMLECVDIDPGTEPLARLFGTESGIFNATAGMSLFTTCTGPNDVTFKAHFMSLLMLMLSCNDDPKLAELERGEQAKIDEALDFTLQLPRSSWRLGTFVSHLPRNTAEKFHRWIYGRSEDSSHGRYARLVDVPQDNCIGTDQRLQVYNLLDVKNDPKALAVLTHEIFARIRRKFERLETRDIPGFAIIDEARFWLSRPNTAREIVESMQTWRKYGKGLELWTQSPDHYLECPGFASLRAAATAFVFLPDKHFDRDKYRQAFELNEGELDAVQSLQKAGTGRNAWGELYIVQREINVSKKVRLRVEPVQEVVSLSDARRAQYRDEILPDLVRRHGLVEGYRRCLDLINERVFAVDEDEAA